MGHESSYAVHSNISLSPVKGRVLHFCLAVQCAHQPDFSCQFEDQAFRQMLKLWQSKVSERDFSVFNGDWRYELGIKNI